MNALQVFSYQIRIIEYDRFATNPVVEPTNHTIGMNANACAILVKSVISPIMLLSTPELPFMSPAKQRLKL